MGIEIKGITLPAIKMKLDPKMSIEDNFRELQAKLSTDFLKNSTAIVDYNGVNLSSTAKKLLEDRIAAHNAEIMGFNSGWVNPKGLETGRKQESKPEPKKELKQEPVRVVKPEPIIQKDSGNRKNPLHIESRTLRGGQRVEHDGDVLVLGNVNADSYIIATGNIIVFGTLRGVAHAGCDGNETAVVIAMKMAPQQLKIAGFHTRPPDDMEEPETPEKAFVEDNQIYIEKI
jgi:septum site-determining protein MinC